MAQLLLITCDEEFMRDLARVVQPSLAKPPAPGRRRRILGTVMLPGEDAPPER